MALDPKTIYRDHADEYHALVLAEDCDQNLIAAIESLKPIDGAHILEVGAAESEPAPPVALSEYYEWLETERGCTRLAIRTDYQFESVSTAAQTLGFFFGSELADKIRAAGSSRVPEVTGLWWWEPS